MRLLLCWNIASWTIANVFLIYNVLYPIPVLVAVKSVMMKRSLQAVILLLVGDWSTSLELVHDSQYSSSDASKLRGRIFFV